MRGRVHEACLLTSVVVSGCSLMIAKDDPPQSIQSGEAPNLSSTTSPYSVPPNTSATLVSKGASSSVRVAAKVPVLQQTTSPVRSDMILSS